MKGPLFKSDKEYCLTWNCWNKKGEGGFVGDFCSPCWKFITEGKGRNSQVFKNAMGLLKEEGAKMP